MLTSDFTGNFGNHIFQYVVTRSIAFKKNFDYGFTRYIYGDYYNGQSQMDFLNLDYGKPVENITNEYHEKIDSIMHIDKVNIHRYHDFKDLQDNSKLVGCWQTERYFYNIKDKVKEWVTIKDEYINQYTNRLQEANIVLDDNTCIINVRGGEYKGIGSLLLHPTYWNNAVNQMLMINPNMKFIVISDDPEYCRRLFPNFPCIHFDIGMDYYIINQAKWLILSNSSFAYFPAWLNQYCHMVIAPKYWSRHNVSDGYWGNSCIFTQGWKYLNRDNTLQSYDEVVNELYNSKYKDYYL